MTRRDFTCPRCGALLAELSKDRTEPAILVRRGVGQIVNLKHQTVTLKCQCGQDRTVVPPKRVTAVVVEREERVA